MTTAEIEASEKYRIFKKQHLDAYEHYLHEYIKERGKVPTFTALCEFVIEECKLEKYKKEEDKDDF